MSFADDMKKKIDELEVERRLKELADEADKTVSETVEKAGALAHERRGEVEGWLGKATEAVNTRTKGQYAEKVEKVRTGLLEGLDKLAAKRPMEPVAEIDAPGTAADTTQASQSDAQADTAQTDIPQADPGAGDTSQTDHGERSDRPTDPPLS